MKNQIFTPFIGLIMLLSLSVFAHEDHESPLAKEPFAFSYHGVLVDTEMKEIELSPKFLEAVLHFYTDAAVRASNYEIYDQYLSLNKLLLKDRKLSELDKLKVRSQIARLVFDNAIDKAGERKDDQEALQQLRRWQEKVSAANLNVPKALNIKVSGKELEHIVNGISKNTRSLIHHWVTSYKLVAFEKLLVIDYILWPIEWIYPNSDPYIRQCRDAGVPIPPAFGSPQWTYVGELQNEFIQASDRAFAYTYTSNSPRGTCIALPRKDNNGNASVLGIICLGLETENACFWDKYGTTAQEFQSPIPISEFVAGTDFTGSAGNCASCHAGENPFVIHPEADISGGANISVNWHNPIFNPTWPKNPGPMSLPSDTSYVDTQWWNPLSWFNTREPGASCEACHKLPDVTNATVRNSGYCYAVLRLAAQRTMAPWNSPKAGWGSSNDSDYQVHIERLYDLCN